MKYHHQRLHKQADERINPGIEPHKQTVGLVHSVLRKFLRGNVDLVDFAVTPLPCRVHCSAVQALVRALQQSRSATRGPLAGARFEKDAVRKSFAMSDGGNHFLLEIASLILLVFHYIYDNIYCISEISAIGPNVGRLLKPSNFTLYLTHIHCLINEN